MRKIKVISENSTCVISAVTIWQSMLVVFLLACVAAPICADDFDTIIGRIIDDIGVPTSSEMSSWLSNFNSTTGQFTDINYADTDPNDSNGWSPLAHVERLARLAKAYESPSSGYYHNSILLTRIYSAYDYWCTADLTVSGYGNDDFYNELFVPRNLGMAMLLLQDEGQLSSSRLNAGASIVGRAYQELDDYTGGYNTGQNRVWRVLPCIALAVVTDNNSGLCADLMQHGYDALGSTVESTTDDGLQRDMSFHQHNHIPHGGGYGMSFCRSVAPISSWGAGTSYNMSSGQIENLVDYLLDGQQWFVRGDTYDWAGMGRKISDQNTTNETALQLIEPVTRALTLGTYRQSELQAMKSRLEAAETSHTANPATAISGNRHFWRSDFMAHHRPNYYASVKTLSNRTHNPESQGPDNLKGLHTYDGVNLIMRSGNEYDGIQPVWDWYRLPGTTTERGSYDLEPANGLGTKPLCGGVSDGTYGATTCYSHRYHDWEDPENTDPKPYVAANKSWFFFDDEFVALGNSIRAPRAIHEVATSINQTLLDGETVTYKTTSGGQQTLTQGTSVTPTDLCWVNHNDIGYFFLTPTSDATVQSTLQSGSWQDIDSYASSTTVSEYVFSLDVNHGYTPSEATYAYVVVPDIEANDMDTYAQNMPITVLRNGPTVTAVRQDDLDLTQAVFYQNDSSTTLNIVPGGVFWVKQATTGVSSMLMLDEEPDSLVLSVASPEALETTLSYHINLELSGPNATWHESLGYTSIDFDLPGGDLAGSTVTQSYAIVSEMLEMLEMLLPGDANRDGVVSAGDYASVQANFGNTGESGIFGDANLDGVVSAGDYASVQANFGNTSPTEVSVPEPATISLIGMGACALIRQRK